MAFLSVRVFSLPLTRVGVTIEKQLCSPKYLAKTQAALISGKHLRDPVVTKPPPFPYQEKKFTKFHAFFDNPYKRFDENSKIIVVEGNIASGKSSFAKSLAEDLGMHYMPEATLDNYYINDYGFDMRQLDSKLPEKVQSFDVKKFYQNPSSQNTARFQCMMYQERFLQYIDALAHLMNTGQGVVLERCVYSDFVFMETMNKFKYVSNAAKNYYYELQKNTLGELLRPHLVIYLDVPPNILQERIKKRGNDYEVKSKVLTNEYLSSISEQYKTYLKNISPHAELLVYDWSNYGDVEVVVEDIERIDFDRFDKYDKKLSDWRNLDYWEMVDQRYLYTTKRNWLLTYFNVPCLDVPELFWESDVAKKWREAWDEAPGNKYAHGYNVDMGDTGLLVKSKLRLRSRPR